MAGIDIISDSTGKEIVAAIQATDVAQARILEINTAAEAKKNEVLESIPEDYSNISKEVDELKGDLVKSTNVYYIDKSMLDIGGYLNVNGNLVPLDSTNTWVSSDFIEVNNLNKIFYRLHGLYTTSASVANIVFYDINKTKLDWFRIEEITDNNGSDYSSIIDVPPYCKYIRICSWLSYDYEVLCIRKNELPPSIIDATDYFTTQNGYINTNGVFKEVANSGWMSTDYIDVSEYNRLDYNLTGSNAVSIVSVYDREKNIINKIVPTSASNTLIKGTLNLENAKYIRLCGFQSVESNYLYTVAKKENTNWSNVVNKPYSFTGKIAFFFGDSITKGFINGSEITESGYPKLFSDSVGMNYTNYGVGGATLSRVSGYGCIYDQISGATLSNADIIFVAGGVNDWQLGVELSNFRTAIINLCNLIKSNFNGEVIFITPIENGGWNPLNTPVADIDDYRNIISEVALTNGFSLINGKTLDFPTKNGNALMISQLFGDKLHPTEKGYEHYAKGLRSILC